MKKYKVGLIVLLFAGIIFGAFISNILSDDPKDGVIYVEVLETSLVTPIPTPQVVSVLAVPEGMVLLSGSMCESCTDVFMDAEMQGNQVTYYQAQQVCHERGGELPTQRQLMVAYDLGLIDQEYVDQWPVWDWSYNLYSTDILFFGWSVAPAEGAHYDMQIAAKVKTNDVRGEYIHNALPDLGYRCVFLP